MDQSSLLFSVFTSTATAYLGGQIGGYISPYTSDFVEGITNSPVLQSAVQQGINQGVSGFAIGTSFSLADGKNIKDALGDGLHGAEMGFGMGFGIGAVQGYSYAKENYINPLTGALKYPPNNGFADGSQYNTQANQGTELIRYGSNPDGSYFSTPGTSPSELSLPPTNDGILNTYKVLYPFNLTGGTAVLWFGQPGGGTQYLSPVPVWWLEQNGYIVPIK